MFGSAVVYAGLVVALAGMIQGVKPRGRRLRTTRKRGLAVAVMGLLLAAIGLMLPARESRIDAAATRLDEAVPAWQFREVHTRRVAAPPARVFESLTRVTADEIAFFNALTWIRRGGQATPESILNAGGGGAPIIDVATRGGFVRLAEEAPRELVIGTVVVAPPGTGGTLTPEAFKKPLPPGFALAAMNFLVTPDGFGGSVLSTETRVFANSPAARRRFAAYWRVIYPGSAIIRRMWLRAIERRAMEGQHRLLDPSGHGGRLRPNRAVNTAEP